MGDEYIEREVALTAQNKSMNLNEMRERLNRIPAADVAPVRHGRWNNIIQGIIPSGQCSNCGAWDKVTCFCPNCGAYMREES